MQNLHHLTYNNYVYVYGYVTTYVCMYVCLIPFGAAFRHIRQGGGEGEGRKGKSLVWEGGFLLFCLFVLRLNCHF